MRTVVPLCSSAAVEQCSLCKIFFDAVAVLIHSTEVVLSASQTLIGRFPIPCHGHRIALLDAFSPTVHGTEIVLSFGVALLCDFAKTVDCLAVVLGNTQAIAVHHAKVIASAWRALIGSTPVPGHGFRLILLHAEAVVVHVAHGKLHLGIRAFGERPQNAKGGMVITEVGGDQALACSLF